ncbi:ATP-binding protein [Streptomonospora sp. PA3]|uniref:ATP-binding protein n=1 Tax=Streptomonospora sp. PA3 TaxID=2607326 RepID=UPI0012DCCE79|nr:ATP-binding protein [Streptomonospora sp. PA3]MUL41553.1 ATP-binding protein [Streptomonospora sp. PA3]
MNACQPPPFPKRKKKFPKSIASVDPVEVTRARTWAAGRLSCTGRIDDVQLVVGELLANALQHAPRPRAAGAPVALLGLVETPPCVEVRVWSRRPELVEMAARCPDGEAESGRGLLLVEAVADAWGWNAVGSWMVVWARFGVGGGRR